MSSIYRFILVILALVVHFGSQGQDTIRCNFNTYFETNEKSGIYEISDINQEVYKQSDCTLDFIEYVRINEHWHKLDTSFYLLAKQVDLSISAKNDTLLFQYFEEHIQIPPHGGESYVVVSYIVDATGQLQSVRILEDVKNRTCDGDWQINLVRDYGFEPYTHKDKAYLVEYIIQVSVVGYCSPLIEKTGGVQRHQAEE